MHRPYTAALLAALSLFSPTITVAADPAQSLEQARALLAKSDGKAAARVLESALPGVSAQWRSELLDLLRTSYEQAIVQAEAEGDSSAAATYRENLAIINHKPAASSPEAKTANSGDSIAPPTPPKPLSTPTEPVAPPPANAGANEPEPAKPSEENPSPEPTETAEAPPGSDDNRLTEADAAFRARQYREAGRLYAELAQDGKLPETRFDPWAYCRMYDVVNQINDGPGTAEQWQSIQNEIGQIRELSPRNWYAEYLRNLVSELSAKSRKVAANQVVVRGSSPEEAPIPPQPRVRPISSTGEGTDQPRRALSPPPERATAPDTVGQAGPPMGNWQVWNTPNFRIFHTDEALARQAARVAEASRAAQIRRWAGSSPESAWSPRCDLYLYPDAKVFSQVTGQPEESPGFSTMGLNGGKVIAHGSISGPIIPTWSRRFCLTRSPMSCWPTCSPRCRFPDGPTRGWRSSRSRAPSKTCARRTWWTRSPGVNSSSWPT